MHDEMFFNQLQQQQQLHHHTVPVRQA